MPWALRGLAYLTDDGEWVYSSVAVADALGVVAEETASV